MRDHVERALKTIPPEQRISIDELINGALRLWRDKSPTDPDLRSFFQSSTYVILFQSRHSKAFLESDDKIQSILDDSPAYCPWNYRDQGAQTFQHQSSNIGMIDVGDDLNVHLFIPNT